MDLFIPPDALEVFLDSFTGPLDLLLYLIRHQNIDILDIPMLEITQQYMQYIEQIEARHLELAADYLVMAAVLMEIKSRVLLPPTVSDDPDVIEEDPRLELVRRLQQYEQFKQAAQTLDTLPRHERDFFPVNLPCHAINLIKNEPEVSLSLLMQAMTNLLQRQTHLIHHQISREALSVRDRMNLILQRLQTEQLLELHYLFSKDEGRMGLVVSLLAILELAKQSLLIITQTVAFSPLYIKVSNG